MGEPDGSPRATPVHAAAAGALVLLAALGCGGLFEDERREGPDAVARIEQLVGPLPPGPHDARTVDTVGIDWLMNGEVSLDRATADAWFDTITPPCDRPTVAEPAPRRPTFLRFLQDVNWASPDTDGWRVRTCEGGTYGGPHYEVSLTLDGDPAWLWIHGITL